MTHELWATLNFKMYEYLSSVKLSDLVEKQLRKAGGERAVIQEPSAAAHLVRAALARRSRLLPENEA
jgi:DNA-binding IscR family transcriptional regulator